MDHVSYLLASDPVSWIERLGLPVALLLGIGFGVVKVFRWGAPIVERLAENQISFTNAIEVLAQRTADAVEAIVPRLSDSEGLIREIHSSIVKGK